MRDSTDTEAADSGTQGLITTDTAGRRTGQPTETDRAGASARRHLLAQIRISLETEREPGAALPSLTDQGEDALVQAIMRHRLAAFLHPAIESGRIPEPLPVDLPGLCRQAYFTVLRRNLVSLELGEAILQRATERGLRATPRGPWAWMRGHEPLHPDPGQRPIDGLYVSAPAEDRAQVRDVARSFGFQESTNAEGKEAGVLWRQEGRMRLPLQVGVANPPPRPVATFVDAVRGLSAVGFTRWLGLLDIHRLVVRGKLDWEPAFAEASRRGLVRPAMSSLRLARELLGTPVPWELLRRAPAPRSRTRHDAFSSTSWLRGNP